MHFIEYDFLKVIKIKNFLGNVLNLNRCRVVINNISIINNMLYIHISTKKIINNMQDIEIEQEQKIEINATEILSKYKSIDDRKLFCFERNWWHPDEKGYDATYFLKVLAGQKKYLPNNFTVKNKLKSFRKGEKFDKKYIISKMSGNSEYGQYVPDNCDPFKLSREFLLTLIAYVDSDLYKNIYNEYKAEVQKRKHNKWGDYNIYVKNDLINDVRQYIPLSNNINSQGGFRLYKNHNPTGVFKQFRNINQNQINHQQQNQIIMQQQQVINSLRLQNSKNENLIKNMKQEQQQIQGQEYHILNQELRKKIDNYEKREKEFLDKEQELNQLKIALKNSNEQLNQKLQNEKIIQDEIIKQRMMNEELKEIIKVNGLNNNENNIKSNTTNITKNANDKKKLEIKISKK